MTDPNSDWNKYQMTEKVTMILQELPRGYPYEQPYVDGLPFLSAYQIALEFQRRFPDEARELGHRSGGQGSGELFSLPSYIAGYLSQHIPNPISHIEIAFLHHQQLKSVQFAGDVTASTSYLILFRLRQEQ